MNDRRRDLRDTAASISRAALDVKWTARDLEAAGHKEEAEEMRAGLEAMERLQAQLYAWAPDLAPPVASD